MMPVKALFDIAKIQKQIFFIATLGIAGNLLFVWHSEGSQLNDLLDFSPGYFVIAVFLAVFPWLGHSIRLRVWSNFLDRQLDWKTCFRIAVATDLGAAITPTVIGGGPIKFGMLAQAGIKSGKAAFMIVLSAFEDLLFFVLMFAGFSILLYHSGEEIMQYIQEIVVKFPPWIVWLLVLLLCLASIVVIGKRLHRLTKKEKKNFTFWSRLKVRLRKSRSEFIEAYHLIIAKGTTPFLVSISALASQWLSRFLLPVALIYALNLEVDFAQVMLMQMLIFVVMVITPTPGATGGAETVFYYLFANLIPLASLSVLMTGWRFLSYYLIILLALLILQFIGLVPKSSEELVASNH